MVPSSGVQVASLKVSNSVARDRSESAPHLGDPDRQPEPITCLFLDIGDGCTLNLVAGHVPKHMHYIETNGQDMPKIRTWQSGAVLMSRIGHLWQRLRSSFWFVPTLIVAGSVTLAVVVIQIDSVGIDQWLGQWPLVFGAGAAGARGMMSTIAGSMITVVGVTFSMILVVLALASSQYTSRILRNFMRSRVTQIVLGIFTGIFTYCLIVLRSIRSGVDGAFVPNLAVSFGFVMAVGGVGALIFFIHHIASSIQASTIIASVAGETEAAIDELFPANLGQADASEEQPTRQHPAAVLTWQTVLARDSGYIESVDLVALRNLACDQQTIVRMEHAIGAFVVAQTPLAYLAMHDAPDNETVAALQATFRIGRHRTVTEDATYGIRQIVDMALKALSPGIMDTTTAVMCVDYLTAILARIASRRLPACQFYENGNLRVITKRPSFESLLDESFDQIRCSSGGDVAIILRLLGAFGTLAVLTVAPDRRLLLRHQVLRVAELAERTVESPHDRARIDAVLVRVRATLEFEPAPGTPCWSATEAS